MKLLRPAGAMLLLLVMSGLGAADLAAQSQELGLALLGHFSVDRRSRSGTPFSLGSDLAMEVNYHHRLLGVEVATLSVGIDFLASQLRSISSTDRTLTRDIATIYLTPDVQLKIFPRSRIQPWVAVGGGVAIYEQSLFRIDRQRNPASRDVTHGAFMIGGGVDVPIWRFVALRGEIRDFYTGSPSYNTPVSGGQNNGVAGGSLVLRFGK